MANLENFTLNFGPQHPAAHGVLRLILEMNGETVMRADPHIGLLHRATEKLAESKIYNHTIGYVDRLDYVSMMMNEHAYVRAIENMLNIEAPIRAQYIRTLFDEITRIMNHLMCIGATALDVGAMSVFLYAFREREALMDCYEAVSGARMHATYYRPGGVIKDLPKVMPKYAESQWDNKTLLARKNAPRQGSLLDFIDNFIEYMPEVIDQIEGLLTENRIWKQRNVDIGVVSAKRAIELGFTGPSLRGSGVAWDLRKQQPYAAYEHMDFAIPVGKKGDCYDRYLVRMEEMRQSLRIMRQCTEWLSKNPGDVLIRDSKVAPPKRFNMKSDMEAQIHHFKLASEGYSIPAGEFYSAIEHSKGEFGVYLVSDGANKPYRVKFRPAGFSHLAAMNEMCQGHMLSDVVAILSSIDIVFGEIDR